MPTKRKKLSGNNGNAHFKEVTLSYQMPDAKSVSVAGEFNEWQTHSHTLKKNEIGLWTTTLTLPPGHYQYRLVVDGAWINDPNCADRTPNEFGGENCVLHV
jgi:1,4-alpha-glucan branching enzyme